MWLSTFPVVGRVIVSTVVAAIQGSAKVFRFVRRAARPRHDFPVCLTWPLDTIWRLAALGATVALAGNGNRLVQGPMVGVVFRASGPPVFRCLLCDLSRPMLCNWWYRWAVGRNAGHQGELRSLCDLSAIAALVPMKCSWPAFIASCPYCPNCSILTQYPLRRVPLRHPLFPQGIRATAIQTVTLPRMMSVPIFGLGSYDERTIREVHTSRNRVAKIIVPSNVQSSSFQRCRVSRH